MLQSLKEVNTAVKDEAWKAALDESYHMEADVKVGMPVDTGRAKAGWGHWTPEDLQGVSKKITKRTRKVLAIGRRNREQVALSSDGIWEEDEAAMTVRQGTNVPYTQWINDGTSNRSGTGHIDGAFERASNRMERVAERLMKRAEAVFKRQGMTSPSSIGGYSPRSAGGTSVDQMIERYRRAISK